MDQPGVHIEDPTQIDPLDAILHGLAEELDGDPVTFQDLLQISRPELGDDNIRNINTASEYFRCVENNKCLDALDFVDHMINVTDLLNYHIEMGTNRVADQLTNYKKKLLTHREKLKEKGITNDINFVGRMKDIERILNTLKGSFDQTSYVGVCICGLGGMGKTSLANEVCYRMYTKDRWRIIKIDLRERSTLLDLFTLTLSELEETFNSTNLRDMGDKLWKAIPKITRKTVLLFDNIDGLLQSTGQGMKMVLQFFKEFLALLQGEKAQVPIKVLITARQKLIPDEGSELVSNMRKIGATASRISDLLLEVELKKLTVKEAMQLYDKCVHEEYKKKSDSQTVSDIIEYCGYSPLAIRVTCSAINGGLDDPKVIRYNLKIKSQEGGFTYALQMNNCLMQTFKSLSKEHQAMLVRLSVFHTAKFDRSAATAVFGETLDITPQIHLLALKTRHFVEIEDSQDYGFKTDLEPIDVLGAGQRRQRYSLHPLVYMFLQEVIKQEHFKEDLALAKKGFIRYFERLLVKIGGVMDKDCMRAWRIIEKNKQHLMNLLKSDPVPEVVQKTDLKERILLCTQMVLIGNLLVGDFHRINRIEKMLQNSRQNGNKLEYLFWKIEKATFFYDLDRNELVRKYLGEIEQDCNDIQGIGTELAPVFGMFFLLKGKFHLKFKKSESAIEDFMMASKLFYEHKFVRHNYLYYLTTVHEKMAQAYLMQEQTDVALKYLSAAFQRASEKVENFFNLDIPSLIASIGHCHFLKGKLEKESRNYKLAEKHFEDSIRYFTKAMALDAQMNLHVLDNYADKLVKRAESYTELGLLTSSGALSDALKDIKEADDLRRKNLQPPHYKLTHTPHLVGKILLLIANQEYQRNQKTNALNHLWEGIMHYEITRDMVKCGGLHPIGVHKQEYIEIKTEHLRALQHAREHEKFEEAIKFFKDFEAGRFEEKRKRMRSERKTIQNSEFIPIEDLKAELMMAQNVRFTPMRSSHNDSEVEEEVINENHTFNVEYEKLKPEKLMNFDKLFAKMERYEEKMRKKRSDPNYVPSSSSSEEDEDVTMETEAKVKDIGDLQNMMEIQEDLKSITDDSAIGTMEDVEGSIGENPKESVEESGKQYLTGMKRKASLSRASSKEPSVEERRKKFQNSRDPSMQSFLNNIQGFTAEYSEDIIAYNRKLSQDKSFDREMPLEEYLQIVSIEDKEQKKKMLEKYPAVKEETGEEMANKRQSVGGGGRKHKLKKIAAVEEEDIQEKTSKDS